MKMTICYIVYVYFVMCVNTLPKDAYFNFVHSAFFFSGVCMQFSARIHFCTVDKPLR
jgi:hypothetical protein